MKETEAHAVKLEGGERSAEQISKIVAAGIPVMGHIGFTLKVSTASAVTSFKVVVTGPSSCLPTHGLSKLPAHSQLFLRWCPLLLRNGSQRRSQFRQSVLELDRIATVNSWCGPIGLG